MKCAHPTCQRGIGLVSHRRGWFGKRLYCSRDCRDSYVAEARKPHPSRPSRAFDPSLLEMLLASTNAPAQLVPARSGAVRARLR
jgi:hypothetical protein